jgi:uridine kinase
MSQVASPLTLGISQSDFDVLAKSTLLSGLSIKELSALLERLDQVAVAQGTAVVREGEEGDYLYFVIEGTAKISRRKLELRLAGPGDHFGELAVVGVRRRSATVTAVTTMRLARLSLGGYRSFSHAHPSAALHFVQAVVSSLGDELVGMTDTMGRILQMRSLPRHSTIKVQIDDEPPRSVPLGTEVRELLPGSVDGALVVAGLTDLRPVSLATGLVADTRLNPLTMSVWEGREIYRRTVCLATLEAARRVAPEVTLRFGPSIGTGRVLSVESTGVDVHDLADRLGRSLAHVVRDALPIQEELWMVGEARAHFREVGWPCAESLLETWRDATVLLARCGDVYTIGGEPFLTDTGRIVPARFVPHPDGLLLDFGEVVAKHHPSGRSAEEALAQEQRSPRFAGEMAADQRRWLESLGVTSVGTFNRFCVDGQVRELIRISEGFHEKRIGRVADDIASRRDAVRIIGIAGPSSSGKTTFIKRLTVQLEIDRLHPVGISLDDYYVDRDKTPRDETGELDFEAFEATDLELLQDHVRRLLAGERVKTARYDFKSGKSSPDGGPELQLRPGDVLVLEGIHGLNPRLLDGVARREQLYHVFVHPSSGLPFDRVASVAPADVRLLRRIVRDRHHRGYKAADNILRWASVRRGEQRHIYPFQPNADAVFDTSLPYELSVLKVYADRYLLEVPHDHPAFATAYRLRHLVDRFVAIYPDHVPPTSLLREFIGGSGFEY